MASKRAIANRGRTDGTFCHRCGERLDDAKATWLVLSCSTGHFYATDEEADATGCNQGGFAFGSACAKRQLAETEAATDAAAEG